MKLFFVLNKTGCLSLAYLYIFRIIELERDEVIEDCQNTPKIALGSLNIFSSVLTLNSRNTISDIIERRFLHSGVRFRKSYIEHR